MKQERYDTEQDTSAQSHHAQAVRAINQDDMMPLGGIILRRAVWCVSGAIIALLTLRTILPMLGVSATNEFASFIYGISSLFVVPFYTIMTPQPGYTNALIEVNSLVAIAVYALGAWAVAKLMTLGSRLTYV